MPNYSYKLVNKDNKLHGGLIKARSKKRAHKTLSQDGSTVLLIYREKDSLFSKDLQLPAWLSSGFSTYEKIIFFRNLATMLSAGVSLSSSLRVFEEQARKKKLKKIFDKMAHDVENGRTLSNAMRKHPRQFSEFVIEAVNVGEITGELSMGLDKIAADLERDYELTRKVTSAMAYPIVIVTVMIAVVALLIVYVLPKISELFHELNTPLPLPTRILLGIGSFFGQYPYVMPLSAMVFLTAFILIKKYEKTRYWLHYGILRIPVFGEIIKEFNLARFFRAVESLITSGVSLVKAVEVSKKTLKNSVYRRALSAIEPVLLHGGRLTDALKPFPFLFVPQVRHIVDVGEKTGKFDEIFLKLAEHYERTINHKTQMLTALIEPVIMVAIGIIVGGVAISIFLPIYQTATLF